MNRDAFQWNHSAGVDDIAEPRLSARLGLRELEAQAHDVETQIRTLEHRPRPTPSERQAATVLKKMRLAMKDRLARLTKS